MAGKDFSVGMAKCMGEGKALVGYNRIPGPARPDRTGAAPPQETTHRSSRKLALVWRFLRARTAALLSERLRAAGVRLARSPRAREQSPGCVTPPRHACHKKVPSWCQNDARDATQSTLSFLPVCQRMLRVHNAHMRSDLSTCSGRFVSRVELRGGQLS